MTRLKSLEEGIVVQFCIFNVFSLGFRSLVSYPRPCTYEGDPLAQL